MDEALASVLTGGIVVVAVGDEHHGDDGAGPMIARILSARGVTSVIDSGSSPELETWRIRELMPENVLFVDAVDFSGSPGDIAVLQPGDLRPGGFDTHRAPLRLTMEYLEKELRCKCLLLAIQPADVSEGAPMCEEVKQSAANVADLLRNGMLAHRC